MNVTLETVKGKVALFADEHIVILQSFSVVHTRDPLFNVTGFFSTAVNMPATFCAQHQFNQGSNVR